MFTNNFAVFRTDFDEICSEFHDPQTKSREFSCRSVIFKQFLAYLISRQIWYFRKIYISIIWAQVSEARAAGARLRDDARRPEGRGASAGLGGSVLRQAGISSLAPHGFASPFVCSNSRLEWIFSKFSFFLIFLSLKQETNVSKTIFREIQWISLRNLKKLRN